VAFGRREAPMKNSHGTLTFAERVTYERAIEEVYWRHRICPKENSNPKRSVDAVMSQVQFEKKVADHLRNSQALEHYWQRSINAEALQTEMERMAHHTKKPDDPFVIGECVARPVVAKRRLTAIESFRPLGLGLAKREMRLPMTMAAVRAHWQRNDRLGITLSDVRSNS
jgi:hypothetical protein